MILVFGTIVALVFLGLRAGSLSMRPDQDPMAAGSTDNSIVELSDDSVLVARPGTISRAVIDWFNNDKAPPKTFDIGWEALLDAAEAVITNIQNAYEAPTRSLREMHIFSKDGETDPLLELSDACRRDLEERTASQLP